MGSRSRWHCDARAAKLLGGVAPSGSGDAEAAAALDAALCHEAGLPPGAKRCFVESLNVENVLSCSQLTVRLVSQALEDGQERGRRLAAEGGAVPWIGFTQASGSCGHASVKMHCWR